VRVVMCAVMKHALLVVTACTVQLPDHVRHVCRLHADDMRGAQVRRRRRAERADARCGAYA
jgi:hypothetical protein